MSFVVGDKVVYPMHGAGIIEAIEEKEVLGERDKYYIMHLPIGDMRIMLPIRRQEMDYGRWLTEHRGVMEILRKNQCPNWIAAIRPVWKDQVRRHL